MVLTKPSQVGKWMNTGFSPYSLRIVSREPGRVWLSCHRDRHLTSSSEGRWAPSNHCPLLPTAESGAGAAGDILLHSMFSISACLAVENHQVDLVGFEPATSSFSVMRSTNWATCLPCIQIGVSASIGARNFLSRIDVTFIRNMKRRRKSSYTRRLLDRNSSWICT